MSWEDEYWELEKAEVERQMVEAARARRDGAMHDSRSRQAWHGTAFVLEAVILIFFLAVSLAIVTNLFGSAYLMGQKANDLTCAVTLATSGASNGAEDFAANPEQKEATSVTYYEFENGSFKEAPTYTSGLYTVQRTVEAQAHEGGTLYKATITVTRFNEVAYSLTTERYVSERRG